MTSEQLLPSQRVMPDADLSIYAKMTRYQLAYEGSIEREALKKYPEYEKFGRLRVNDHFALLSKNKVQWISAALVIMYPDIHCNLELYSWAITPDEEVTSEMREIGNYIISLQNQAVTEQK